MNNEKNDQSRSDHPQLRAGESDPRGDHRDGWTLNLNDHVWIRLLEPGRAILRKQDAEWSRLYATTYGRLVTAEKQEADNAGWSRWQLWSLIMEFGHAVYLGCDPPFETTIRLDLTTKIGSVSDSASVERAADRAGAGSAEDHPQVAEAPASPSSLSVESGTVEVRTLLGQIENSGSDGLSLRVREVWRRQ